MVTSDPDLYSIKIYKYPTRKILGSFLPLLMVVIFSILVVSEITLINPKSDRFFSETIVFFLFYIFSMGGIFLLYLNVICRSKLLVSDACIELRTPGKYTRLSCDHIAGVRRWVGRNGMSGWEFVPTDPAMKPLRVPVAFKTDRDFVRWLREFPDLTRAPPEGALAKSLASNLPGRGPEEIQSLINDQTIGANFLNIAAIGLSILFLFQEGTLWLAALLFALPWIAGIFVAASRGVATLTLTKSDPRPSVALAMALPAVIFIAGPPFHTHLLVPMPLATGALLVGAILLVLAVLADRSLSKVRYGRLIYFLIFSLFAAGSAAEFNVELDGSPGDVFLTTASDKQGFSFEHPQYQITLAPWGAVSDQQSVSVSKGFFSDTLVGRQICVSLHPGALGMPWYTIFHCQS